MTKDKLGVTFARWISDIIPQLYLLNPEGKMVYLVDDDKSVRRAFELFLKSAGLEYLSFESANDFLEVFQQGSQDTLVLDLNLPGMSGCDLLTELDRQGIHMPVIVVTAFDDVTSQEKCRQYGVKAHLRKPVDGETLIDIIQYNANKLSL